MVRQADGAGDSQAGFRPASPDGRFASGLDALNVLLADVRGALGPHLNMLLVARPHWSRTALGWVTTVGGLPGLAAQTPIGAAIDATRSKRGAAFP